MITKIEAYKCSNGRIFDNLIDAQRYESRIHLISKMVSLSKEDQISVRKIIADKCKPGFPDF